MPLQSSNNLIYTVTAATLLILSGAVTAVETAKPQAANKHKDDPHYTSSGFFDIHVCNWPDRELFFMPLFSTIHYREISDIKIQRPDGKLLTSLDLSRFKLLKQKDKPDKHVFMTQINVAKDNKNGWYTAIINMTDGTQVTARDYVIIERLPRASNLKPANGAEQIAIPKKLSWTGIEGGYYQVFIRDVWNDSKLIHSSKLLNKPEFVLPAGLLEADGLYSWRVHSRDVNEDVLLGDFNKGSLSQLSTFSTAAEQ